MTPEERERENVDRRKPVEEIKQTYANEYKVKPNDKWATGAPTKYHPDFCQKCVDWLSQGFTFQSFAAEVGTCIDTLYAWAQQHSEFSAAKKHGEACSLRWREKFLIGSAAGKLPGSNMTGAIFMLKCHPSRSWRETTEVQQTHVMEMMTDDQLEREYKALKAKVEDIKQLRESDTGLDDTSKNS
jgi:hypothetical protein